MMPCCSPRRAGTTLLELLVGLTATAILAAALLGLLITQLRVARSVSAHVADAAALRITESVLAGEVRHAYGTDVRGTARDSLALRFFRAGGTVCFADATHLHARLKGDRAPDPAKDSVIVVRQDGSETVVLLAGAERGVSCGGSAGKGWRLRLSPPVTGAFVLVFESGAYHLTDGALRYRLGREGRQPITDERFAGRGTGFVAGTAAVSATLSFRSGDTAIVSAAHARAGS